MTDETKDPRQVVAEVKAELKQQAATEPAPTPQQQASMGRAIVLSTPDPNTVDDASLALFDSSRFGQLQRVGNLFAASFLVPDKFQKDQASCAIAVQMAMRWQCDPLMVMQHMYVVHGRPAMDAQFLMALAASQKVFATPIQWLLKGEGMGRECTAYAMRADGTMCEETVTMQIAKSEGWLDKQGSKWKTIPENMLRWRSASWLIRFNAPGAAMGMYTREELEDSPPPTIAVEVNKEADVPLSAKEVQLEENRKAGVDKWREKEARKDARKKAAAVQFQQDVDRPTGWDRPAEVIDETTGEVTHMREPGEEG